MVWAQSQRPGEEQPARREVPQDVQLTRQDRERLREALTHAFPDEASVYHIVTPLGVPTERLPPWGGVTAEAWWIAFLQLLNQGVIAEPYRRLIDAALARYGANPTFVELYNSYVVPAADRDGHVQVPAGDPQAVRAPTDPICHVIVRADNEHERATAAGTLVGLGLRPQEVWSTAHAVSYRVDSDRADTVRRALDRTDLGWTLVPPGQPDYLLRELFITGPDGSRFRVTDTPAAQTVGNVVTGVVEQYEGTDGPDASRPTVADRVGADGERRRLDMDDTLHDAGIQEGDNVRIGFEGRAGAVDSFLQQDALERAYRDIVAFAATRPDMTVRANRVSRPTEYEISFVQDSFGPPEIDGGQPHRIDRHMVLLQLGPEFPVQAPSVFWLSQIFHPNVFPTYDCDQSRANPHLRGLVCLGMFAESWVPDTSFGDVLRMLVAMAGFRNYELFQFTGEYGPDGPQLRANYYDRAAAAWAHAHPADIVAIGGKPVTASPPRRRPYPNVIDRLDRADRLGDDVDHGTR